MKSRIRVLIADDHAVVREGIRRILGDEPDVEVVGEASDGRETVEKALKLLPDVVLMDLTMPLMNGFEATAALRKRQPNMKVLVLTIHEDEAYLCQALRVGARGYVVKSAADTELTQAIRVVRRGEVFLQPSAIRLLAQSVVRSSAPGEAEPGWRSLTPREQEILKMVAAGLTSADVARQLSLSARTGESSAPTR